MNKKIITISLISILSLNSITAFAEPLTLTPEQQQELQNKTTDFNNATNQVNNTQNQVLQLSTEIGSLNEKIDKTKKDITEAQENCKNKQEELDKQLKIFSGRLRAYYKEDPSQNKFTKFINLIFEAENLSDMITKVNVMKKVTDTDKDMLNRISDEKEALDKAESDLEDLQEQQNKQSEELGKKKSDLDKKLAQLMAEQAQKKADLKGTEDALVQGIINTINSSNLPYELKQSISTLKGLLGLMTTEETKAAINNAISVGENKIATSKFPENIEIPDTNSPIVSYSYNFLGIPYLWGGTNPNVGLDCSGFVQLVYAHFGYNIGRTTYDQINDGIIIPVSLGTLQPGDLIFFGDAKAPHHVAIYIGDGKYIHAPHTGDVVKISDGATNASTARRIIK